VLCYKAIKNTTPLESFLSMEGVGQLLNFQKKNIFSLKIYSIFNKIKFQDRTTPLKSVQENSHEILIKES
jgi:hypothetical protein